MPILDHGRRSAWLWCAIAVSAGCSSVPDGPAPAIPTASPFVAPGPFDAMDPAGIWGEGDRVEFAIEIVEGGDRRHLTFALTTKDLPTADPDRNRSAHPVHGHVLTRSSDEQWQHGPDIVYVGTGPAKMFAELRGDDGSSCAGELTVEAIAHFYVEDLRIALREGVHELFAALLGLDCVHAELLRVIRAPGVASVLANLGRVQVGLEWPRCEGLSVVQRETPFGVLPTFWLPVTLTANGQEALVGRLLFTWKQPPLLPCAGVLEFEGRHPEDETKRVFVRLASARRGVPPDRPAADDLGYGLRVGMTRDEVCAAKRGTVREVHTRGTLGDGRDVELVEFAVPGIWLFGVLHEDRLLFACPGDDLARHFLALRGFVPERVTERASPVR